MNFLKKLLQPKIKHTSNRYTILTGGHLKYTQDLIRNISKQNTHNKFLVLNKNYKNEDGEQFDNNLNEESYAQLGVKPDSIRMFNCDLNSSEDIDELSYFIKSNEIKIKDVIHSDHFISCMDHSQEPAWSELKYMTQSNIENAMLLNSKLIATKKLEIDSKIFHLILPQTSNLVNIPNFNQKRMLGQALKHMVNCCKRELMINPVFFSLITIESMDEVYIQRFENNETIPLSEIEQYKKNYDKSIELISTLMSNYLSGLEFGEKFWGLDDRITLNSIIMKNLKSS